MPLRNVTSHFELQAIKCTTALPLGLIDDPAPQVARGVEKVAQIA
jgi:hypothetical protein